MFFTIVGCGRVGAELAFRLFQGGHHVVVVDQVPAAFNQIPADFRGRIVTGAALTRGVLERAGVDHADGLAAVTNSDTLNAVVAHIAKAIYNVPNVVVRNFNPRLRPMLEAFNLQVVGTSSWGAQRVVELLAHPDYHAVFSAGQGEVEVYELRVPKGLDAQPLEELVRDIPACRPVAVTRSGLAILPQSDFLLEGGDILLVGATFDGIKALRARLTESREV